MNEEHDMPTTAMEIEITPGQDEAEDPFISVSVSYLSALIRDRQELHRLRAPDGVPYLAKEHPELIEWQGMTVDEWAEAYPEDVDYSLYEERGDC